MVDSYIVIIAVHVIVHSSLTSVTKTLFCLYEIYLGGPVSRVRQLWVGYT